MTDHHHLRALLAEVDTAHLAAVGPHPDLTVDERLALWHHYEKLVVNRFPLLAKAYLELLHMKNRA